MLYEVITYISAEDLETQDPAKLLEGCDGILVPGGFGKRGVEGKINAIHYARENKIPFFGICLGMQLAVVEFVITSYSIHYTKLYDWRV